MDNRDTEVTKIRQWMRWVMETKDWSAEHWARVAETSPTNITRFLKDAVHLPSTRTLAKLASACGSMPEIGSQVKTPVPVERRVPLYSCKELLSLLEGAEGSLKLSHKKVISTMQAVSQDAFAVTVRSRRMETRGISPGDIVICEPVSVLKPKLDDVVLYAIEGQEDLETGLYKAPWIDHQSMDPNVSMVEIGNVTIVGVGVEVRRSLSRG